MHIPCPNCTTGWVLPEVGHSHLRACSLCHGTGYLTAQGSGQAMGQKLRDGVDDGQGVRREPEANTYSPSFDPQSA
ncbi:MAG: hypothetical protein NUV50_01705 [Rhodospirillales bacterium]|nr:hypothetical protein [Rhodospirillales bacterium]